MPTENQIEAAHAVLRERNHFVPWEDLTAALDAAERAAWSMDMEAAPRDGTSILVRFYHSIGGGTFEAWWDYHLNDWTDGSTDDDGELRLLAEPAAWRPLPTPPEASDE